MAQSDFDVVTGAFGFSGRYITQILLDKGRRVRTLTGHPDRPNPFGTRVEAVPFNFNHPEALTDSLRGADTLYNTYWVRLSHGETTFDKAIANTNTLVSAAVQAGVRRIVHVSIANPSEDSPFPYYRGKAAVERMVIGSGLSYAILRPAVLFGKEGILLNNIAWMLRHLPVFGVPGDGQYRIQPTYVADLANLAVTQAQSNDNVIMDAVGPETYKFIDLAKLIRLEVGSHARILKMPPQMVLFVSGIMGKMVGDIVLTKEEIEGLMANLLGSDQPPTCPSLLSEWLWQNSAELGTKYISELAKHYK